VALAIAELRAEPLRDDRERLIGEVAVRWRPVCCGRLAVSGPDVRRTGAVRRRPWTGA